MLFCAAQAPELFGRDQRYGVLPLYFSRALTRTDYALAKHRRPDASRCSWSILVPQLVLFVGRVLRRARTRRTGLADELPARSRGSSPRPLADRGLLGGLASLIAAWTPRRAYATAAIIAVLHHPADRRRARRRADRRATSPAALVLLSPGDVLDGANACDLRARSPRTRSIAQVDLPGWRLRRGRRGRDRRRVGLTIRRYQRIAA